MKAFLIASLIFMVLVGIFFALYPVNAQQISGDGECIGKGNYRCIIDVPPKEWDETHNPMEMYQNGSMGAVCPECPYTVHRATCEDKSRFLLTSEDGKKHCLKLGEIIR